MTVGEGTTARSFSVAVSILSFLPSASQLLSEISGFLPSETGPLLFCRSDSDGDDGACLYFHLCFCSFFFQVEGTFVQGRDPVL